MIAYELLAEYFWKLHSKLHCGNAANDNPNYGRFQSNIAQLIAFVEYVVIKLKNQCSLEYTPRFNIGPLAIGQGEMTICGFSWVRHS